jgi:hypothetical protein
MHWVLAAAFTAMPYYAADVINRGRGEFNSALVAGAPAHCTPTYYFGHRNSTSVPSAAVGYTVVCTRHSAVGWEYATHVPGSGAVDIFSLNATVYDVGSIDNVPAILKCRCNYRVVWTARYANSSVDLDVAVMHRWERQLHFDSGALPGRNVAELVRPSRLVKASAAIIHNVGPLHVVVHAVANVTRYFLAWNVAESESFAADFSNPVYAATPPLPPTRPASSVLWLLLAGVAVWHLLLSAVSNALAAGCILAFLVAERNVLPIVDIALVATAAACAVVELLFSSKFRRAARLLALSSLVVALHRLGKRTSAYSTHHFYVELSIAICLKHALQDVRALSLIVSTRLMRSSLKDKWG